METGIILAAGRGSRMHSDLPKPLHRIAGQPMLQLLISEAEKIFDRLIVVVGKDMPEVEALVAATPHTVVIQHAPLGTGDAARIALREASEGGVTFLYADNPLLTGETMKRLLESRKKSKAKLSLLGMRPLDPKHYGRILCDKHGDVQKIVEWAHASESERAGNLCNAGMISGQKKQISKWLEAIQPQDAGARNEYYLTDIVELASSEGKVVCVEGAEDELGGINTRAELACAEKTLQKRLRARAMENGVTFIDPESVFLSVDTDIAQDVTIEPHVFFGPGVKVEPHVQIRAFSHLEGARIQSGAVIGPYARLRQGTNCGKNSRVGNFVELKNTHLGTDAKASHLTYLGDASVGQNSNIGAGVITCNYDGFHKHKTEIGKDVFVGSDSILIAPIRVGEGAMIAAGSVITRDVKPDALVFARSRQNEQENGARIFRIKQAAKSREPI